MSKPYPKDWQNYFDVILSIVRRRVDRAFENIEHEIAAESVKHLLMNPSKMKKQVRKQKDRKQK